ncbi:Putative TrmH family tRNA/rRNA methyltransferase [Planctomycetes bacterium Poly30]|uniref:TrmH family tRNA/rRNA methyltransferase n=1 Tax=Saltatorellus ferox TaxID=2528018 RepID=A0A518EYY4_9BACT|nr:Putative TrmH family tRNA/rRNA methyltransferase [Planctomycetes bacterium Poly30]
MSALATILHGLKSPINVGSIVRTHVAMGGGPLVMVGLEQPWRFGKGSQAFSRKLETLCEITYLSDDSAFFEWCARGSWVPVALEIRPEATPIHRSTWPERAALVLGNERTGLSDEFLAECDAVVRIPQFGPVASLNVAIAHGMAAYELQRSRQDPRIPVAGKYPEPYRPTSKPQ